MIGQSMSGELDKTQSVRALRKYRWYYQHLETSQVSEFIAKGIATGLAANQISRWGEGTKVEDLL